MKKVSLLIMAACFIAVVATAEDVTLTETFSRVSQTSSSGAGGSTWQGDLCHWTTKYARRGTNDKINSKQSTWLTLTDSERGFIKTTDLEGGIKRVAFQYAQFGAEAGIVLRWQVSVGEISNTVERDGDEGVNKDAPANYSHDFNCKTNAQLEILNMSIKDDETQPTSNARLLFNNIVITPYLLYRNKVVTVGLKQKGFVNNNMVNNIGEEGTISYESSDVNIAKVDAETGIITPVAEGNATITATWSEGASTSYTVYVVDGIVAENFGKVNKLSQVQEEEATWHGDLFDWKVLNTRRGYDDTLGLAPRIQATAFRKGTGETFIYSNEPVEGGIKNITFDWRQWASGTTPLIMSAFYSADKENWGDTIAKQSVAAAAGSTPHVFNEDIDDGTIGNAYLKLAFRSGAGHAVVGAIKITPWLLYETKAASIDLRLSETSYKNNDLINNTTGDPVVYEISKNSIGATINAETGEVTAGTKAGVVTITAKWKNVTTSYELTILDDPTYAVTYTNMLEGGLLAVQDGPTLVVSGDEVKAGTELTIIPTPGDDYEIESVTVNGTPIVAVENVYKYTMTPEAITVNATFKKKTATGVEEVGNETVNTVRSEKKLRDGQLIIIREGKKYNAQGAAL